MDADRKVTIFHQALLRGGGMEHYAIGLARSFKELGWDVLFYGREADPEFVGDLKVRLSPGRRRVPRKLRDWQFYREVRRVAPEIQGLQIALSRVPVRDVIICGGTHKGYLKATGRFGGPFDWLQTRIEAASYASASRIISHSGLCTRELQNLYAVPEDKIRTIYPPVDERFRPGDSIESRRQLGLPAEKMVLLFPSMGHTRKGLRALCEALQPVSDQILLAIAGKPADTFNFSFVRSLGYVQDMAIAYRAADFTILGSWYEPFGMVGPESVLCGTRLLFEERIGCLPALARDAALRFSITSPASIRAAVSEALRLKAAGTHRVTDPQAAVLYDPNPIEHARTLAHAWRAETGNTRASATSSAARI